MRMLDFARSNRLPLTWRDTERADDPAAAALVADLDEARLPLVQAARRLGAPRALAGEVSRALGIGRELAPRRRSTCSWSAPARPASAPLCTELRRASTRSWSRARGLGGQAGTSRRIENYLGFPAGISGSELTSRAVTQARKFNARMATPYRARSRWSRETVATSCGWRTITRSPRGPS